MTTAGRAAIRREAVAAGYSGERLPTELTADLGRPVMARQPMPLTGLPAPSWRETGLLQLRHADSSHSKGVVGNWKRDHTVERGGRVVSGPSPSADECRCPRPSMKPLWRGSWQ